MRVALKSPTGKRVLLTAVGSLVCVSFVAAACGGSSSAATVQDTKATVTKGDISITVSSTGNVSFPNTRTLNFGSGGYLKQIMVQQGDIVRSGQTLATLDQPNLAPALASAKNTLAKAQKSLSDFNHPSTQAARLASAQQAVADARLALDTAKRAVDTYNHDFAAQLAQAQQSKTSADTALDTAKQAMVTVDHDYAMQVAAAQQAKVAADAALDQAKQAVATIDHDFAAQVAAAQQAKIAADVALTAAQQTLANAYHDFSVQLTQAEQAVAAAQIALQTAQTALTNVDQEYTLQLAQAQQALDVATIALTTAQTAVSNYVSRNRANIDQNTLAQLQDVVIVVPTGFPYADADVSTHVAGVRFGIVDHVREHAGRHRQNVGKVHLGQAFNLVEVRNEPVDRGHLAARRITHDLQAVAGGQLLVEA